MKERKGGGYIKRKSMILFLNFVHISNRELPHDAKALIAMLFPIYLSILLLAWERKADMFKSLLVILW